ncbi:MAG: hypothetical protein Q4D26_06705 [Clostridia bacterium]|nr:hypothetical protein [Clostridia bacterium]
MKTKNTSDYPFISLLENINLGSDDKINLEEVIMEEDKFFNHIKILGMNPDKFINAEGVKVCLADDLNSCCVECRTEGFINGYVTALKISKGEIL